MKLVTVYLERRVDEPDAAEGLTVALPDLLHPLEGRAVGEAPRGELGIHLAVRELARAASSKYLQVFGRQRVAVAYQERRLGVECPGAVALELGAVHLAAPRLRVDAKLEEHLLALTEEERASKLDLADARGVGAVELSRGGERQLDVAGTWKGRRALEDMIVEPRRRLAADRPFPDGGRASQPTREHRMRALDRDRDRRSVGGRRLEPVAFALPGIARQVDVRRRLAVENAPLDRAARDVHRRERAEHRRALVLQPPDRG